MKRAIIRVLFGECDPEKSWESGQRKSVDSDIVKSCKEPDFLAFVAGEKNYSMLHNLMDPQRIRLVDKNPWPWPKQVLLRNKIHLIGIALKDYDEVVYLDWDCISCRAAESKDLERMWLDLEVGQPIRSLGWKYVRPLCLWRKGHIRKCANTGFLYARRNIWPLVEDAWERTNRHLNDEVAVTRVMDDLTEGYRGVERWTELYDVIWARMRAPRCCPQTMWENKMTNALWVHYFR